MTFTFGLGTPPGEKRSVREVTRPKMVGENAVVAATLLFSVSPMLGVRPIKATR